MSGATKIAAVKVIQNFPDAGALLSQKISAVTSVAAAAANKQTDTTGIKELTVCPITTACLLVFDAPNDAVVTAWFADTTTDANVLQYVRLPIGIYRTFTFSSAITRWDFVSEGTTTAVWQEIAR